MRYWVYFKDSDKVSEVPYEPKDLYTLPSFNHETLIQPEIIAEGAAQEWLAAYNFTDVQEAAEQVAAAAARPPAEELPAEPEVYEEPAPAPVEAAPAPVAQPVPVQPAPAAQASGPSDLEKMLMEKLEQLNRELAQLKQQQTAAPVPAPVVPAAIAPAPESQPAEQPAHEDTETILTPKVAMDDFLGDVIKDEFSNSQKKTVDIKSEPQPPAELNLVDLKSLAPAPVEELAEAPAEGSLTPLPPSEELQAEELQAEPFAVAEPASPAPVEHQPDAPEEQTAPVISAPNTAEDSVLDEFAQDKINTAPRQTQTEEGPITTLDELTGRSPLRHPDGAPRHAAEDDKFLKTFTTGIEEVFMDQPTSVISDYVPPADAGNFSQRNLLAGSNDTPGVVENLAGGAVNNIAGGLADNPADKHEGPEGRVQNPQPTVKSVRRIKPIAIKTVPMVSADGQDIQYEGDQQLEEVIIESGSSPVFKLIKMFCALVAVLIILFMFLALLAWMSIIPKSISPAHGILGKIFKNKTEAAAPAPAADLSAQMPPGDSRATPESRQQVIANVKNYLLLDGLTLGEKINLLHPNQAAQIQWTADPAIEPEYFAIAVKLPPNNEGYSLTYRFSYNIVERVLAPTTSEANNLMNQRIAL